MTIDYELISDLTFSLAPDELVYIAISGVTSNCLMSVKIDAGAKYVVQSSLDSTEEFKNYATHSDAIWEDISVDGVVYPEVTFAINSLPFRSPNILYIKNTSAGTENIKVALRGNR